MSKELIKRQLLRKLANHRNWGGKRTSFDNLPKGFPEHLKGEVKEAAKELIKEGFLVQKPPSYRLEVSLNPRRKKEIYAMILEPAPPF